MLSARNFNPFVVETISPRNALVKLMNLSSIYAGRDITKDRTAATTTTTTTTTTKRRRTDVGSLCHGPRLFVYVSAGLMAPALRARRIYFSPSVPALPPSRSESFEHLTFMEYLEISFFPPFPATVDGRQSSDCCPVRHPRSDLPSLLSIGASDFCGASHPRGTCLGRL